MSVNLALLNTVKGIVHPEMTILSSLTHTYVISNLYDFLINTKDILKNLSL